MIDSEVVTMFHAVCDLCNRVAPKGSPIKTQARDVMPARWEFFQVGQDAKEVCVCAECLVVLGVIEEEGAK